MFRQFVSLIHAWFHADRIRISPLEGRLAALRPGQQVLIRRQLYQVAGPLLETSSTGHELTVALQSDTGPAVLTIQRCDSGYCQSAQLRDETGQVTDLFNDDVQILRRQPSEHRIAVSECRSESNH